MTGSAFIIDLPGPVPTERLAELRARLAELAAHLEEPRVGSYDVDVEPSKLGVQARFTINIAGPGFGDEGVFRAAHADDPDLEPLIGFTPTHDVVIATTGSNDVDRVMVAELTAVVHDAVGGAIAIELSPRALRVVRSLPGIIAVAEEAERARVFCTAEFLRAWVVAPEFGDYVLGAMPHRSHW